jgi:FkbM family methyltransferase
MNASPPDMPITASASASGRLPTGALIEEMSPSETRLLVDEIFVRRTYPLHAWDSPARPVIVDIGSNIGIFVHYAKHVWPNALVYAVEPVPPVAAVLRRNVAVFGADVQVIECGIGAAPGFMEVTFYPGYSIMSRMKGDSQSDKELLANCIRQDLRSRLLPGNQLSERHVTAALGSKLAAAQQFRCAVTTLPQLLADKGLSAVDFLKMDVEGSERDVLRSLSATDWAKIRHIALEVHEYQAGAEMLPELRGLLDEHGFRTSVAHATAETCPRTLMLYGATGR